jgi:hypothetical protein
MRVSVKLKRRLDGVKPSELEPMALILHGMFDAFVQTAELEGAHTQVSHVWRLKFLP